jgi:putative spermidine/putrescine transport system substrate-binding protein
MNTTANEYNSNLSRREFMRILGITGVGVGLMGVSSCFPSGGGDANSLRFWGSGTLDIADKWKQLEQDLGLKLLFSDNGNDTGPIIANMLNGTAANDFDLGGIQGGVERELAAAGKILPWDTSKIENWSGVWDWVKKVPHCQVDGKQYGLPVVVNADSVIYLPEKIGGKVDSYGVIFDPKFKGRTAMEDAWINSVIFAAIYLKENNLQPIGDPGDLTESELGAVMEFLIKHKKDGQFKTFWRGWEDGVRLIKSGEVYAMTGWEPIVYAAKDAGINAEYAIPREGYEGWSNDLVIHVGAEQRGLLDKVHQFANWELGGYYGCELAKTKGYIVPNNNSIEYAKKGKEYDPAEQEKKIEHVKAKFLAGKVYWQNTRPKNFKLYEEWWAKLRNA